MTEIKLDSNLRAIISMERPAREEANYLLTLYQDEALQIAQDCRDLFEELERFEEAGYWEQVCHALMPTITKH